MRDTYLKMMFCFTLQVVHNFRFYLNQSALIRAFNWFAFILWKCYSKINYVSKEYARESTRILLKCWIYFFNYIVFRGFQKKFWLCEIRITYSMRVDLKLTLLNELTHYTNSNTILFYSMWQNNVELNECVIWLIT
jgi:hypothetical protein